MEIEDTDEGPSEEDEITENVLRAISRRSIALQKNNYEELPPIECDIIDI